MTEPYRLIGAPGSPYSMKMRALMRFRRLPMIWDVARSPEELPPVPVKLFPVLVFPGAGGGEPEAMIDSTFQIRRLEGLHDERGAVPADPAVAVLDALIEDFADEWLTKAMFHYRWAYPADISQAGSQLPLYNYGVLSDAEHAERNRYISSRQIGRLGVVGSNETTAPLIEAAYQRLLGLLTGVFSVRPFIMGTRPGVADFAVYGQLSQLALFDPTPQAIAYEQAPRVPAWCQVVEDLSGFELEGCDWLGRDELNVSLKPLLTEVGGSYAPFLIANAAALQAGAEQVECEIEGRKWLQSAFPYQGKCLVALRRQYAELSAPDRAFVDSCISGSGCEPIFAG